MADEAPRTSPWLHGPAADLLLGCGGAYLLLLLPLAALGPEIRLAQPLIVFPLLSLFAGAAHYGATLTRVYEQRADRRSYAIFSVWASGLVALLLTTSLWVPPIAVFLVTLYLSWSPWHYTGQNYGIAVMFLRRAGIEFDTLDKRWIYASFLSSFLLVLTIAHRATGDALDIPVYSASQTIRFRPIGIPTAISNLAIPLLIACYVVGTAGALLRLTRRASLRDLFPFALLLLAQLLWFVLPLGARWAGWQPSLEVFGGDFRTHYFIWIATAHSTQYLWVTSYYARSQSLWKGQIRWYAKVLAAGSAIWMLPALLLGPLGFGPLSMDQGLAILIAAAVNIHHFILDGAIWKLRGRIAEVLIRGASEARKDPQAGSPLLRRFVWACCAVAFAVFLFQTYLEARVADGKRTTEVHQALDRLAWLGLDGAQARITLGSLYLSNGRPELAREQFQRSLDLTPLPRAWTGLGRAHLAGNHAKEAIEAFRNAQAGAPDHPMAYRGEAEAWMQLGDPDRAVAAIERAADLAPQDTAIQGRLRAIQKASGRVPSD